MKDFFAPTTRRTMHPYLMSAALLLLCACQHRGPLQPLALSPVGHGGPLHAHGKTASSPLWRANVLSAPFAQSPCRTQGGGRDLVCATPHPKADAYAEAMVFER